MAIHVLSHNLPAEEIVPSRRETRVETPSSLEPNQEWSAVLRETFENGRLVDSELEQFVLTMPPPVIQRGVDRTFAAGPRADAA